MNTPDSANAYVDQLRASLRGLTVAERQEIVDEIYAHIRERLDRGMPLAEVLQRLGPPAELAAQYSNGAIVQRSITIFSPFKLLRTAFRWSMTGVHGIAVFFVAFIGYVMGIGFIVLGMLKPFFPADMGLWAGDNYFSFGWKPYDVVGAHELLGPWFTQVTLVLGALIVIATNIIVRALLARLRRWKLMAKSSGDAVVTSTMSTAL